MRWPLSWVRWRVLSKTRFFWPHDNLIRVYIILYCYDILINNSIVLLTRSHYSCVDPTLFERYKRQVDIRCKLFWSILGVDEYLIFFYISLYFLFSFFSIILFLHYKLSNNFIEKFTKINNKWFTLKSETLLNR